MVFATENPPRKWERRSDGPRSDLDRIRITFDDHRLVANAGLMLPVTLAHHPGLGEPVDDHVDLGEAPGRANAGDKMLTLVASDLAEGDCIDDAGAQRWGNRAGAGLCGESAVHAGELAAELRVGPRAPATY